MNRSYSKRSQIDWWLCAVMLKVKQHPQIWNWSVGRLHNDLGLTWRRSCKLKRRLWKVLPPGVKRGERGFAAETWEISVTQRKMADMPFLLCHCEPLKPPLLFIGDIWTSVCSSRKARFLWAVWGCRSVRGCGRPHSEPYCMSDRQTKTLFDSA